MYKKIEFLHFSIALSICFCSFQIFEKINQKSQTKIIVYAINKHGAIDFIAGQEHVLIADDSLLINKDKMRFHLIPNLNNLGLNDSKSYSWLQSNKIKTSIISSKGNYLFYREKIILTTARRLDGLNQLIYKPEIILLNASNKLWFQKLFQLFPEAKFICDGTISPYLYQKLKSKNHGVNLRSVLNEGAITIEV
jgi:hypothetical protein